MEEKEHPTALISLNDLNALSIIMQFYERYLWNISAPSAKRSRQSVEVHALIVKLFTLPPENPVVLTVNDIGYINAALNIFTSQIVEKMPPSPGRNIIVTSCQKLQDHINTVFSPNKP